jgi:peptidoglycan pentaglycine glycine transferase (the first glycine)
MSSGYELRPVQNREQWDEFVSSHSSGHLLQSWNWGELKAGAGWHPLRLALFDTRRDVMVAAAQVLRRAPVPLRLGHLAYIPRGPVLDWSQEGEGGQLLWRAFFAQLLPLLKGQGAIAVQVELPQLDTSRAGERASACLNEQGFRSAPPVQPIRSILLDLAPGEDALLAGMKEKWRYNVRLAVRRGVEVRPARDEQDVRAWYRLLQTTGQRDGFGIHTLDYYLRAWQIFAPRQQAQLLLAEYDGRLLAGIFVGCMARQAIYLYGASGSEARQLMPNYLLQWEAIRRAKRQGARSYDFWGIPATDDPGESMAGVYRFKSGWGGQVVRFAGNYERAFYPRIARLASTILH